MTKGFSKPGTNDIGVKRVYRMSGSNSRIDHYNYIIQMVKEWNEFMGYMIRFEFNNRLLQLYNTK